MKKACFLLMISLVLSFSSHAQPNKVESFHRLLKNASSDTTRVGIMDSLANYYVFLRPDSSLYYALQEVNLAEKINYQEGEHQGYVKAAFILNTSSNYPKAMELGIKSLKVAEQLKTNRELRMAESHEVMGNMNWRMGNDSLGLMHCLQAIRLFKSAGAKMDQINFGCYLNSSAIYLKRKQFDSAIINANLGYQVSLAAKPYKLAGISVMATQLGRTYTEMGNYSKAREYFLIGLQVANKYNSILLRIRFYNNYARFFRRTGNIDSCIYYSKAAVQLAQHGNYGEHGSDAASILAQAYESIHNSDSALKYMNVMMVIKDSIFNQTKVQQFQLLNFDESQRQRDISAAKERYRNQIRFYLLIAAVTIFLFLTLFLYRNNRNKQKANRILEFQKTEIDKQRSKAENALQELRSTQTQLIQSEKMASLGELTAGIAHEIQNPLNFVNNFSEVNAELLEEMKEAFKAGNPAEALNVALGIQENNLKIIHHGKRADSIVKGMLQHARTGSGQKEPSMINVLAEEYLRLSYNGMRAREKSFHATLRTHLDDRIENVQIVPQEIGRVLLNIYNNAFFAISEKEKQQSDNGQAGYEPTVTLSTSKMNGQVQIKVKDNGNGMPQKVVEKIFQPFFTTKPAGQGTGLGLSMSYDIIKAHGGELKVETREGEFTEFAIYLPTN